MVALRVELENRNNIDKIIGAITGKTREQHIRIEELQGNIKSYEADKRLDEIKQQQVDSARQEAESKRRDQDRSNDNRQEHVQDKTKEAYLDRMSAEREEKRQSPEIDRGDKGRER